MEVFETTFESQESALTYRERLLEMLHRMGVTAWQVGVFYEQVEETVLLANIRDLHVSVEYGNKFNLLEISERVKATLLELYAVNLALLPDRSILYG